MARERSADDDDARRGTPTERHAAPAYGGAVTSTLEPVRTALRGLAHRAALGQLPPVATIHRLDPTTVAGYRSAAVLLLFTPSTVPGDPGVDLFLVQRSPLLRHHPGQIALPGGRVDPTDAGIEAAALRETHEEIGLPPERVEVLGRLPEMAVPVSSFVVTPVLGWAWDAAGLEDVDAGEVLHTLRLPVSSLLDPASRATVTIHDHGSAGFAAQGGWVWGFTGNLLDHTFDLLGWTLPWDRERTYEMSMAEAVGATLPPATAEG
ncbi:NUDIX hydrolase [Georgenia sunbinii]|uniref:NUDIX hydrolase n=1 Tax=Georgenia sunbinii TaxID=3117728 RepID=UPI002F269595